MIVIVVTQVVYQLALQQDTDILTKFAITTEQDRGVLRLTRQLDFEEKRLYQVVVEARDRASQGDVNTAQATVLVQVSCALLDQTILTLNTTRWRMWRTDPQSGRLSLPLQGSRKMLQFSHL